jgi:hypothetical protein
MMTMSMVRITKTKVDCMLPYRGRLGCFVKGALRTKNIIKRLKMGLRLSKSHARQAKCQKRIDYNWDGEEANFADFVLSIIKEYLFQCFKFLKDGWMEYDKGQESFLTFVQEKVKIPERMEYKDQWQKVICPTIQAKYVTIRCHLNNEIQRTYKSKSKQMRTKLFQHN